MRKGMTFAGPGHRRSWVPVLATVLLLIGLAGNASAAETPGTLAVSARAELRVEPDLARFGAGVETRAETVEEARDANARAMEQVREALLAAGAEERNVRTSSFTVQPDWRYDPSDGSRTLIGYIASHTLQVTVTDLARLGSLLDAALQAGATSVNGPTFGLSNQEELEGKVLAEAIRRARQKADVMAVAAGVFLKRVTHISEHVNAPFGGFAEEAMVMRMAVADSAASTSISPGEISITATVNITYEI